jgi:D-alanyl-D-alanine dipeptidase
MSLKNALVPLNAFKEEIEFSIDLIYAQASNPDNHFANLYSPAANILWVHERLAAPALTAALNAREFGWVLEFKDCLRPVDAQKNMSIYGYDERLVSRPGEGAHPRAMAIDVVVRDRAGVLIDMGTPFDFFAEADDMAAGRNPAARNHADGWTGDPAEDARIARDRKRLETLFLDAAAAHGETIVPLPDEWWDFRFPPEVWSPLPAAREADLYPFQRLMSEPVVGWAELHAALPASVAASIERVRQALSR